MKTLQMTILALGFGFASFTPTQHKAINSHRILLSKSIIQWKSTEISLGDIPQSKPVTIEFEFTNTGDSPVVITSVQASCGCTATDYSKTPVAPGEKTKIKAVFNAANKGAFKKQVTVVTSADQTPQVLTFSGTVI